jgi:hypothetical protein
MQISTQQAPRWRKNHAALTQYRSQVTAAYAVITDTSKGDITSFSPGERLIFEIFANSWRRVLSILDHPESWVSVPAQEQALEKIQNILGQLPHNSTK